MISKGIFSLSNLPNYKSNLFVKNITNRIFILINVHYSNSGKELKYSIIYSHIKRSLLSDQVPQIWFN